MTAGLKRQVSEFASHGASRLCLTSLVMLVKVYFLQFLPEYSLVETLRLRVRIATPDPYCQPNLDATMGRDVPTGGALVV